MRRRWVVLAVVGLAGVAIGVGVIRATGSSPSGASRTSTTIEGRPDPAACGPTIYKDHAGGEPWRCSFVEDFDGQAVDPDIWHLQTSTESGFGSNEECYLDGPENISVRGGVLRLSVVSQREPIICTPPLGGNYYARYTSGSISTYERWSQQYGRFEVRAKFPRTARKGLQGAIWLWPDDQMKHGPWPASGEIDVAEAFSLYPDRAIPIIHYLTASESTTNNFCLLTVDEWHTYSLVWTPTTLTIAYDGATCLTHEIAPLSGAAPEPFDQPFFVALTYGVGVAPNTLDPTDPPVVPATLEVDYVRAWT
jgi:beta-glucanase (GH16 family)